jgi:diacylglycerol kinase
MHTPNASSALTFSGRIRSVQHAVRGVRTMLLTQHNAWIHAAATVVTISAGFGLGISPMEWCMVVLAIVAVWTAEALNTALEYLTDIASSNYHPIAGRAKDIAAGAVLICAIGAAIVGLIVFGPRVLQLLKSGA